MSYQYSFQDNEVYGADDVNKIISRLMTEGVAVFQDGAIYTPSDLNGLTEQVAGMGITSESNRCKVIKGANNQFIIQSGEAIFSDGSAISVDSGNHTLNVIGGVKNYIYFKKEETPLNAYPVVSSTPPQNDDIPLAEYDPNTETLTDTRIFSMSKISGFGTNIYDEKIAFSASVTANGYGANQKIGTITGLRRSDYKFITIRDVTYGGSDGRNKFAGYASLSDDSPMYFSVYNDPNVPLKQEWEYNGNHMGYTDFLVNIAPKENWTAQYINLVRVRGNEFDIHMISYGEPYTFNLNVEFNFC